MGVKVHYKGDPTDTGTLTGETRSKDVWGKGGGYNTGSSQGQKKSLTLLGVTWDDGREDWVREMEIVRL